MCLHPSKRRDCMSAGAQKKRPILSRLSCTDCPRSNKPLLTFAFVQLFTSVAASAKRETQKQTSHGICFLLCPTQDIIFNACAQLLFYPK